MNYIKQILLTTATLLLCFTTVNAQDMKTSLQTACGSTQCFDIQREVISGNIVHYSATLKVGTGSHEVIGLHRVVKEISPWVPKSTPTGLLVAHGDFLNFKALYLTGISGGSTVSSFAYYMANHDVDLWGIDTRWAKVPVTTTDTSFMSTWNLESDAKDARIALGVARIVRGLTNSGYGLIKYLGYSRGGQIAYVALQQESQLPSWQRNVNAAIIVDVPLKTNNPSFQSTMCNVSAQLQTQFNSGVYADSTAQLLQTVGNLAVSAPNDPSPIPPLAGLTNLQGALLFGGATYLFNPYLPTYHLIGSNLGNNNLPVSFRFTDQNAFFKVMQNASPFESVGTELQGAQVICGDTPLDDHLHDITVPVFYVGASGGLGQEGVYTTTLLGSSDVQTMIISLTTSRLTDFGHDDLIRATNSPNLVWQPILSWLSSH